MNELHSVLEALDIAADAMEVESDRSREEGVPDEAEQEKMKAQHYRELKRSLVNDKMVLVKSEDMA